MSGMAGMTTLEYGGGGAPQAVAIGLSEMSTATNKSFTMCAGLGHGLVEALLHYGTAEQKQTWLPNSSPASGRVRCASQSRSAVPT